MGRNISVKEQFSLLNIGTFSISSGRNLVLQLGMDIWYNQEVSFNIDFKHTLPANINFNYRQNGVEKANANYAISRSEITAGITCIL